MIESHHEYFLNAQLFLISHLILMGRDEEDIRGGLNLLSCALVPCCCCNKYFCQKGKFII